MLKVETAEIPRDAEVTATLLEGWDRAMYDTTFKVDDVLRDLQDEHGALSTALANSFAALVQTKFTEAAKNVKQNLHKATVASMLLERDFHSRGKSADVRAHDDDDKFRASHHPAINDALGEVASLQDTFSSYGTTPVKSHWYIQKSTTVNNGPYLTVESYFKKFDTPVFLRDIGFTDLTQLQYNPDMLRPPPEVAPDIQHVKTETGQPWLNFWMDVLSKVRRAEQRDGADYMSRNVLITRNVMQSDGASAAFASAPVVSTHVILDDIQHIGGELYSKYKPLLFDTWTHITFEKLLKLIYALFTSFDSTFDKNKWEQVSLANARAWLDDVLTKQSKLRFTTPAENAALFYMISRDEVGALFLAPYPTRVLVAQFISNRRKPLMKQLELIQSMKDCASNTIPSTSRYSIETIMVQMIRGVAQNPLLYSQSHINFVLMGDAGAGKTFYARIIASIMKHCGLLISKNNIDIVSKPDLVGDAIGATAPKTKRRLVRDLQNVMFIDEAYTLTQIDTSKEQVEGAPPKWEAYGFEAIGELINFLDKNKGNIAVIAAGYEDQMRTKFLAINEGMPRRFPFQILLPNYSAVELTGLFCTFLKIKLSGLREPFVEPNANSFLQRVIEADSPPRLFPNSAGDIENLMAVAGALLVAKRQRDATYALNAADIKAALNKYAMNKAGTTYDVVLGSDVPLAGGVTEAEMANYEQQRKVFEETFPNTELSLQVVTQNLKTEGHELRAQLAQSFAVIINAKFHKAQQFIKTTVSHVVEETARLMQDLLSQQLEFRDAEEETLEKYPTIEEGLQMLASTFQMFEPYVNPPVVYAWQQQTIPDSVAAAKVISKGGDVFGRVTTMESYYGAHEAPLFLRDIGKSAVTQFQYPTKVLIPPGPLIPESLKQPSTTPQELLEFWLQILDYIVTRNRGLLETTISAVPPATIEQLQAARRERLPVLEGGDISPTLIKNQQTNNTTFIWKATEVIKKLGNSRENHTITRGMYNELSNSLDALSAKLHEFVPEIHAAALPSNKVACANGFIQLVNAAKRTGLLVSSMMRKALATQRSLVTEDDMNEFDGKLATLSMENTDYASIKSLSLGSLTTLESRDLPFPPESVSLEIEPALLFENWMDPQQGRHIMAEYVNDKLRRDIAKQKYQINNTAKLNWDRITFADVLMFIYSMFHGLTHGTFAEAEAWLQTPDVKRFTTAAEDMALQFVLQRPELAVLKLSEVKPDAALHDVFYKHRLPPLIASLEEMSSLVQCDCSPLHTVSRFAIEAELAGLIQTVARNPEAVMNSYLNFILMGPAGSGKTRYAQLIASVIKNTGLLISRKPIDIVSRSNLVGQYLGETAPLTRARLISDRENVVFLDEAYTLTQKDAKGDWDPYGFESIGEIINFLDKNIGSICFIAAGYEREMRTNFLEINQGQRRRFPYQIVLPDYNGEELVALLCYFIKKFIGQKEQCSETGVQRPVLSREAVATWIQILADPDNKRALFPNSAGDVENFATIAARLLAFKRARGNQAAMLDTDNLKHVMKVYCFNTKNKLCDLNGPVVGAEAEAPPLLPPPPPPQPLSPLPPAQPEVPEVFEVKREAEGEAAIEPVEQRRGRREGLRRRLPETPLPKPTATEAKQSRQRRKQIRSRSRPRELPPSPCPSLRCHEQIEYSNP